MRTATLLLCLGAASLLVASRAQVESAVEEDADVSAPEEARTGGPGAGVGPNGEPLSAEQMEVRLSGARRLDEWLLVCMVDGSVRGGSRGAARDVTRCNASLYPCGTHPRAPLLTHSTRHPSSRTLPRATTHLHLRLSSSSSRW